MSEPVDWQSISEQWRATTLAWQSWAEKHLARLGMQPEGGLWGDEIARKTIAAMTLTWTREAPTVPGWYWLRRGAFAAQIVDVINVTDSGELAWRECDAPPGCSCCEKHPLSWAGPIEPPTEPETP